LTCTGKQGVAAQTATVSVTAPPPTISFHVSPSTIRSGSSAALTWLASNATSCNAGGAWSGSKAVAGSQSTGTLDANASYSLKCSGPGGVATQTVTVSVSAAPPVVTLTANPSTVQSGSSATLSWKASNATSCLASGGWSGAQPVSGSKNTVALGTTTTFTLTCDGPGGAASQSAVVTVAAIPPSVSFGASPTTIPSGATSLLTWTSSNANSCTASGGWSGSLPISGSRSTAALTTKTTYTITCTGSAGSATESATVSVESSTSGTATLSWSPPTANTNGTPLTPLSGYTIFYGTSATHLTHSIFVSGANTVSYEIKGLTAGTWYFAVAADAKDGTQSAMSALGSKTF